MKKTFCVFILISCVDSVNAQFITNLFTRYHLNELRNQNLYRRWRQPIVRRLPLKCEANSIAKNLWEKGEGELDRHALELLRESRWDEEIKVYSYCIQADSAFCDAYFRLAQCLVERTDWVGVLNLLTLAEKKFSNEPLVYMGLGQALSYLQYPDQALKNFEKLIAILPTSAEGYLGASWASYEIGEPQKALDYLHQGYEKVTGDIQYLKVFESIMLYDAHRTRQAFDLLSSLENEAAPLDGRIGGRYQDPFNINMGGFAPELKGIGEYYLGLCYAAKGEDFYGKASSHIKIAKKEGIPIDTTLARELGLSIDVDNLKEQLLSMYHLESVVDKKSDPAADEAFENRQIDEAAVLFLEQIKRDSTILHPYLKLAECFQIKQESQKALTTYKLAFQKFPKDEHVMTRLTRQLIRVDSLSPVLKITMAKIAKHPSKKENYYQAALILNLMNRTSDAIKLLKEFAGKEQSMPWRMAFVLGEFYFLSGEFYLALPYFRFAIQHGSHDPYLNYYYAKCMGNLGYCTEAKKYFYKAMELGAVIDKDSMKKFQVIEKQSTPYAEKY